MKDNGRETCRDTGRETGRYREENWERNWEKNCERYWEEGNWDTWKTATTGQELRAMVNDPSCARGRKQARVRLTMKLTKH